MPVIAIVDGYSTGSVLGRMLIERGVRCVHVRSGDDVPEYFRKGFRAGDYEIDLGHVPEPLDLAARLRDAGVGQVVAGTESGVALADLLNHLLGTPGNDIGLVAARRDKALMADAVRAAGLAVPSGDVFDSVDAATAWYARQAGVWAVVKPVDSAGTDNVWFCENADEVRRACESVLGGHNLYGTPNRKVLVQERLRGTECYVNTVSVDGVHKVAEIWRYTKRAEQAGTPIYDYEEPLDPADPMAAEIRGFVFAVLDALGIRSSAAHTEVMLTDRGPVLIETGARLGGATIPDVVEKFSGVSQAALLTRALVEPSSLPSFDDRGVRWATAVRNVALINSQPVREQSADWAARIAELRTAVGVAGAAAAGAALPMTVDLITSPGFVYLAAEDPDDIDRDYRALRALEARGLYGR